MKRSRVAAKLENLGRSSLQRAGYDISRTSPVRYLSWAGHGGKPAIGGDRLSQIRQRYAQADTPLGSVSYWNESNVADGARVLDSGFRGDGLYVWQFINGASSASLREAEYEYYLYLRYLERIDDHGLLDEVAEDGAFGAPLFDFPGRQPVSRDVLDSVNEILYLDRMLGILAANDLRVLDVGAGYGRLGFRMSQLVGGLSDYACIDGIPDSTFACETYLDFRNATPPCRVIELPDVDDVLHRSSFDLAVNIHSFSEMPSSAVQAWLELLAEAEIPSLLVIPNETVGVMSTEEDGSKIDMTETFDRLGYELVDQRPIIDDEFTRELIGSQGQFHLYSLRGVG